jgi:hypothetical protein
MALATWVVISFILVVVVVLLIIEITQGRTTVPDPPVVPASEGIVRDVTTLPAAVFNAVGSPGPPVLEAPVILPPSQPHLTVHKQPAVVYIGAEFCPYCAAERWPLVVALGRFGTFSKLGATSSSDYEVFPEVKTFAFAGSTYHSRWVDFAAVEEYGAVPSDNAPAAFGMLKRPASWEQQLLRRFGGGASGSRSGSFPFVDVANVAIVSGQGVGFSPSVLEGLTMGQIADQLKQPASPVAQAVVGAANDLTAALCVATGDNPASVCLSPGVRRSASRLGLSSY